MNKTTNFDLNLVTGSDLFNPLTTDNPNYEKIDTILKANEDAAVQTATEAKSGNTHQITTLKDAAMMRFKATSDFRSGDIVTVNGAPVTAVMPDGSGLADLAWKKDSIVLAALVDSRFTVYTNSGAGTATNAEKLGGQPPEYYGTAANSIHTYTHSRIGNVNNFVGVGSNGKVQFTANISLGDTIQVNGETVTAYAGTDDFVTTMAGAPLIGKWFTFTFDSGVVNFNKAGGGKVTVSGMDPTKIAEGHTISVKQGSKTITSVTGKAKISRSAFYMAMSIKSSAWQNNYASVDCDFMSLKGMNIDYSENPLGNSTFKNSEGPVFTRPITVIIKNTSTETCQFWSPGDDPQVPNIAPGQQITRTFNTNDRLDLTNRGASSGFVSCAIYPAE